MRFGVYGVSQKSSPPKIFRNISTQTKCISVNFFQYVASLHLHMCTNFGRFILIFNKMASIFLGVTIVLTLPVLSFIKSNRRDFIANNRVVPNSSDLNPLDYQAWGNARVLLQAATEAKTVPKLTDAL